VIHFDLCSECDRLTTQGLVCDACLLAYEAHAEDDLLLSEMASAALSHSLPEKDAKFLGLQLNNPLA
jgi:hypothetical protein